ncbi:MAG: hypothetical protein HY537_00455 [Deltaproteobacteria bacterium]|nr:hypothetical protein [Deltaproteobacteria bacterium]
MDFENMDWDFYKRKDKAPPRWLQLFKDPNLYLLFIIAALLVFAVCLSCSDNHRASIQNHSRRFDDVREH